MPSDYDRIRCDNIREYGEGTRHLAFLGRLYTDRTHFIFELLQNAEDAKATRIRFVLAENRLEVMHDGRLFDEMDVRGICGVGEGTKAEDLTQIGKFGIGFKSVYAYTLAPEIHSGDEHFRIEHYVRPYATRAKEPGPPWTTLFVFPFDTPDMEAEKVAQEIGKRLCNLNVRTLLFLRNISEIEWAVVDGSSGFYVRQNQKKGLAQQVTVIGQNDEKEEEENWLVFERPVPHPAKSGVIKVEIAFRLVQEEKSNRDTIIKTTESPLVVFFPTEKETRFGFLIQGPYRTTPSRDNIPPDDEWNKALVKETAKLVVDTLHELKGMRLLSISLLEAMPIRLDDFPEGGMFTPIADSAKKAFKEEALLPAEDGSFISAKQAKLARGTDLRELLSPERLQKLYDSNADLKWLSEDVTQNKTPDLYSYLIRQLEIEEIIPDAFARRITELFLETSTDEWMVTFYEFLTDHKDLWKKADSVLRQKKFLRLEDDTLVTPRQKDGKPNAYLPGTSATKFPTIKRKIADNPEAREFLLELGILEPDLFAEIIEYILPKYSGSEIKIENEENDRDLNKISQALQTQLPGNTSDLVGKLRIVFARIGLEEYMEEFSQGRKIDSNFVLTLFKIALHSTPLFRAVGICTEDVVYKPANQIYIESPDQVLYFDKNIIVRFLDTSYSPEIKELCLTVGGGDKSPRITCRNKNESGYIIVANHHGRHTRGLDGFDPECEIDSLECALTHSTREKATYIWNELLIPNGHRIQGIIESSSKKTFENCRREKRFSKMGQLLVEKSWLPGKAGQFHKPCELSTGDLPEGFKHDENLARQLSMKSVEKTSLAHELNLPEAVVEFIKNNRDEIIRLMKEIESRKKSITDEPEERQNIDQRKEPPESINYKEEFKKAFARPSGTIKQELVELPRPLVNAEGYREKIAQETQNALEKEPSYETRFRRVPRKVWEGRCEDTRKFLEEEYQGRCQVCDSMFIKRKDQKPYFEGLYIVHRTRAKWIEHRGNILCLCPTCCAKFQYGPIEADDIMEQVTMLRTEKEGGESIPRVSIQLCGEECCIRFSERHLVALQELLNAQGYMEGDGDIV